MFARAYVGGIRPGEARSIAFSLQGKQSRVPQVPRFHVETTRADYAYRTSASNTPVSTVLPCFI
jgi:hypothetical protein